MFPCTCAQLLPALPQELLFVSLESDLSSNRASSHCLAGWPGTNHSVSLTLRFHICNLGVIVSLPLSQAGNVCLESSAWHPAGFQQCLWNVWMDGQMSKPSLPCL